MSKHNQDEIGPYEVAQEAGIPPASVYYFFPKIEDLWVELTKQAARQVVMCTMEAGLRNPDAAASGWQSLYRVVLESTVNFYNAHPSLAELILGPTSGREITAAFDKGDLTTARMSEKILKKYYVLPHMPKLRSKLLIAIVASEAILKKSYRTHGVITQEMQEESFKLLVAYLRGYLPEYLELR